MSADDGVNGEELWTTDGTTGGTVLLMNAQSGIYGSQPVSFAKGTNRHVFLVKNSLTAPFHSLIETDGTILGTEIVEQYNDKLYLNYASGTQKLVAVIGEKAILRYQNSVYGTELFVTDGTEVGVGTKILKDIYPGRGDGISTSDFVNYFTINNKLVFPGTSAAFESEPWVTDGTTDGTIQLADINMAGGSNPTFLGELNGFIYFIAEKDFSRQLFKTDGTVSGTTQVFSAPANFIGYEGIIVGSQIFLTCDFTFSGWFELCKSDGTLLGTSLVKDIYPGAVTTSGIYGMVKVGNRVVFTADDGTNGVEFWGSDGTEAGTVMLSDAASGAGSQYQYSRQVSVVHNGIYYFDQTSDAHGLELWRTDGTVAGTFRLTDIKSGPTSTDFYSPIIHEDKLFFSAVRDDGEMEIYSTDGTVVGTTLFIDLEMGVSSYPYYLASVSGNLFFHAYRTAEGYSLFHVRGLNPATLAHIGADYPTSLIGARGKLYFQAISPTTNYVEFYKLVVDACPDDATKSVPGVCGCGVADADDDLDGTLNCNDSCPIDPAKIIAGVCGCGIADADTDSDGVFNCSDGCISDPTKTSAGVCGCGVSDADSNGNGQADCLDDAVLNSQPGSPRARYNRSKDELTFTLPAISAPGAKYLVTVSQLKSKNGRVLGRKRFETSSRVTKKRLSRLLVKGKKLRGWISVTYQVKIGTRKGVASRAKKLFIG